MTRLAEYINRRGPTVQVGHRIFTVEGISSDGDIRVATFKTARTSYQGVLCINARVRSRPQAEVWSVIGRGRTLCEFAVDGDAIHPLG